MTCSSGRWEDKVVGVIIVWFERGGALGREGWWMVFLGRRVLVSSDGDSLRSFLRLPDW